jgi:hypothetical protein
LIGFRTVFARSCWRNISVSPSRLKYTDANVVSFSPEKLLLRIDWT